MRPREVDQIIGQDHLLASGKPLRRAITSGQVHSMILWGPPGCGKTTLARVIANHADAELIALSAVLSGVADIRKAIEAARGNQALGRRTLLFVDEVHRFNKSQQDAFLPHVESGLVTFIGATTENPSFEVNNALLSRVKVYVLKTLSDEALASVLAAALADTERGLPGVQVEPAAAEQLVRSADGDARRLLNFLEIASQLATDGTIDAEAAGEAASQTLRRFDKGGDAFYDQISALHKSVRSSDPDAALYWCCRMIDGGCDPRYLARRVTRMAVEDIGLADPRGLRLALDGWETYERLGSPEGELAIAQAVVYLAACAKSNATYMAYQRAMADARESGSLDVPTALRNAPTRLMKQLGYGKGYQYDHDVEGGVALEQRCFPDEMEPRDYYRPTDRGLEARIGEKLEQLRSARRAAKPGADKPDREGAK